MNEPIKLQRLLLVDDEANVLSALQRLLRRHLGTAVKVDTFNDPLQALQCAYGHGWDVVLTDYRMPGLNGLDFLRKLVKVQPDVVRMVLSASADLPTVLDAVNDVGVFRYLVKPWQPEQLVSHVVRALEHSRELKAQRALADEMRVQRGELGAAELERRRLEAIEPGITHVEWGPNGEVMMPSSLLGLDELGGAAR